MYIIPHLSFRFVPEVEMEVDTESAATIEMDVKPFVQEESGEAEMETEA